MHSLKPLGYVRYGDDFVLWASNQLQVQHFHDEGVAFLGQQLRLTLHAVNHALQPTHHRLHMLGLEFWPSRHRLDKRRILKRVDQNNIASYQELLERHGSKQLKRQFLWEGLEQGWYG